MVWTTKPPVGTQLDFINPINNGLVGCWIFNEGSGTVVNDLSGNGNNGILTNMIPSATSGWINGRLNTPSISFDGMDDYINIGNNASLNISNEITISAWIKVPINNSPGSPIFGKSNPSNYDSSGFSLIIENGILRFFLYGTPFVDSFVNTGDLRDNIWHNVVIYYNNVTHGGYLDGNLVLQAPSSGWIPTYNNYSGIIGYRYPTYGNISIDDFRIWNRSLLPNEVSSLFINPYGMFSGGCPQISCNLSIT